MTSECPAKKLAALPTREVYVDGKPVQFVRRDDALNALNVARANDLADAYVGAREDLAEWKRRALRAEAELRPMPVLTVASSAAQLAAPAQPASDRVLAVARRTLDQGLCFDKTAHITCATDAEILRFAAELLGAPHA
jgi:hypothetical protein